MKFPAVDKPFDLPGRIARCGPIAAKLDLIRGGGLVVAFEHVTEPAQPLLAALIARHVEKRIWIICENVRAQEMFHGELLNWLPDAVFFPEMDAALGENIVPDPEVAAERLEILQKLSSKRDQQIVVASRASLDDPLPSPGGLKQISLKLSRSKKLDRAELLVQLQRAGYESAAQVSTRGQFAVRGGIVDIYSWHHTLPVRLEFFDDVIESIRQFDLDTQTSVQQLDQCTLLLGETGEKTCKLVDYFHKDDLLVSIDTEFEEARVKITHRLRCRAGWRIIAGRFSTTGSGSLKQAISWCRNRSASVSSSNCASGAKRVGRCSSIATTRGKSSACAI